MGLHSLWSFSDAFRNSDFSFLHFSLPFYFHISLYTTGAKRHSIPSESIYISVLTDKKRNVVSKCNERGGGWGWGGSRYQNGVKQWLRLSSPQRQYASAKSQGSHLFSTVLLTRWSSAHTEPFVFAKRRRVCLHTEHKLTWQNTQSKIM